MSDNFSCPRERREAYPKMAEYCRAQDEDGLARLIWDTTHQRNVFATYSGTNGEHARAIVRSLSDPARQTKVMGIQLTLTRALGMYGAAYDPPGPHRAYTYEHQPANGPAWNLGCAVSALQQYKPGDAIDTGLYLLKEMQARGLGIFEIEPKAIDAAPQEQTRVPDGWALVPSKPSREMIKAGERWSPLPEQVWQDMIDAAPVSEVENGQA